MKTGTQDLIKFKRLQRRLGVSIAQLVGHLELLWNATAKNAPEGDIGRFSNEEIAVLCYWDGDYDLFVNSLIECGWLDISDEWRLLVHDWAEHAPNWVKGALKRHHRDFHNPMPEPPNDTPMELPKETTKDAPKETAKEPPMDTTTKSSHVRSGQVNNTLSHTTPTLVSKIQATIATLPEPIPELWVKWLEVYRARYGPMPEIQQESVLLELLRREGNMQADLEFSIRKGAKSILDHTSDYQKHTGSRGGSGSKSLTKGERIKQEAGF